MMGFFGLGILFGLSLIVAVARVAWHGKFYPGITIAQIDVSGLSRDQAKNKILEKINVYQTDLSFNGMNWKTPVNAVDYLVEASLNDAYHYGRRLKIQDYLLLLINKKTNYPLIMTEGRKDIFEAFITEVSAAIEINPTLTVVSLEKKKIKITNGSDGLVISSNKFDDLTRLAQANLDETTVVIPTETVETQLGNDALARLEENAEKLIGNKLTLKLDDNNIELSDKELIAFMSTEKKGERWNYKKISEYVELISNQLNKDPKDAKFEFSEGKVKEFSPGKDGVIVNAEATIDNLQNGMDKLLGPESKSETVEIVVTRTPPEVTTEEVNKYGINERIGRGESFYAHSIPNRIYNVALASSRVNSALIPPGEDVSFNKMVGEVSGVTGYRQAYIIEKGRTVLGDGGGLCQVSTTMFRAAMAAGLPILERWGHSYRVSYYELNSKPGVDATVIAPSKDFRFRNDTPGHILIQTINDPKSLHLVIEIYGTSDGRVATITEPKVWNITPPLPTVYQDDPSLPSDTMKQVDWAASGAQTSFEYKVVRNGETLQEKTFSTTYRPWASVFLRGISQ